MAEEKIVKPGRAFRWKGPGILQITRADGTVVIIPPGDDPEYKDDPRCRVRKPENLLALGVERVEQFIQQGLAEALPLGEKIAEALKGENEKKDDEISNAEKIVQQSANASAGLKKVANAAEARAKKQGREEPERKLPDMPTAGPNRS